MPSIQVKNVPPDVHRVWRRRAAEAGMSLQEYLLAKLTEEARQPTLEEVLEAAGRETGGRLSAAEAVEIIRADRDSR
jgi:plasmid stability protein